VWHSSDLNSSPVSVIISVIWFYFFLCQVVYITYHAWLSVYTPWKHVWYWVECK
jgi:hypothetical protein